MSSAVFLLLVSVQIVVEKVERVLAQVGLKANNAPHVTVGVYITYVLVAMEPGIFLMKAVEIKV